MLSAPEAAKVRDLGIALVQSTVECGQALVCIAQAATRRQEITSDDAWAILEAAGVNSFCHPNAMGAAFRSAALCGLIEATGKVRKSSRVSGRRRNVQVWKSLVYQGGGA